MLITTSILLDCLFLLLGEHSEEAKRLVTSILDYRKSLHQKNYLSSDSEAIDFYCRLLPDVMENSITIHDKDTLKLLLLKLKSDSISVTNPEIAEILSDLFSGDMEITPQMLTMASKMVRNISCLVTMEANIKKIYGSRQRVGETGEGALTPEEAVAEIEGQLEEALTDLKRAKNQDSGRPISSVRMTDPESVGKAVDLYYERSVTGLIQTGLQGLNNALGKRKGIGLGESVMAAARSHNWKSGLLLSFSRWIPVYNPHLVPIPDKKFLVYMVSVENDVSQNIMDVFKMLYCLNTGEDPDGVEQDDIKKWIVSFYSRYRIDVIIESYRPEEFSPELYDRKCEEFKAQGYQLLAFILDYIQEVAGGKGRVGSNAENDWGYQSHLYTHFSGHAKVYGYVFLTGHQLTKKADEVASLHRGSAVKHFNWSMLSSIPDAHRKVDIIIFLNIESNIDDDVFITFLVSKNRNCKDTPLKDRFGAYPFSKAGIEDDLGKTCRCVKDIDTYRPGKEAVSESDLYEEAVY